MPHRFDRTELIVRADLRLATASRANADAAGDGTAVGPATCGEHLISKRQWWHLKVHPSISSQQPTAASQVGCVAKHDVTAHVFGWALNAATSKRINRPENLLWKIALSGTYYRPVVVVVVMSSPSAVIKSAARWSVQSLSRLPLSDDDGLKLAGFLRASEHD